ncbi:MAG: DegT/DnrJ/EryC1/StrS family aminotransferase [Candidatus Limnocylindrales bacterium]
MPGPGLELIGQEEIDAVVNVLKSGHLARYGQDDDPTFLATVQRLENAVAARSGVRHAVAMNSGTSALWAIMTGLGIGPGDEVIVPGFTFVASISSTVYTRARPVLAEVDESLNLDPADVESRITPRTRAILVVHMLGNPARLAELKDIADRHGLWLIEDAAQAFGASYRGSPVGSIGIAGALSFNIFKTITCGDGGMVITDDTDLYRRIFAIHDQGHLPLRKGIEMGKRPLLGLNLRMTELSGAVLLAQLEKLDRIRDHLRAQKARFKAAISDLPGIRFRDLPDPAGDLCTFLTVFFPTSEIAENVTRALGTKVAADSGWHIYNHMEHVLDQRTPWATGCPFNCDCTFSDEIRYRPGMLPRTDEIAARALNIGIGVDDPNLGSAFGVTMRDGPRDVDERAARFCEVARRFLV